MSTQIGETEGRGHQQNGLRVPIPGDLAQRTGRVRVLVNRRDGSRSDLSDPFYLLSGSFET